MKRGPFARFHRPKHHKFFVGSGTTDGVGCRSRGPGYGTCRQQLMGGIIDEMIRGYAKGYLFGQMVVGCFFFLLFAVFLGALLVLLVTTSLQGGHKKTSHNEARSAEKVWHEFGKKERI